MLPPTIFSMLPMTVESCANAETDPSEMIERISGSFIAASYPQFNSTASNQQRCFARCLLKSLDALRCSPRSRSAVEYSRIALTGLPSSVTASGLWRMGQHVLAQSVERHGHADHVRRAENG